MKRQILFLCASLALPVLLSAQADTLPPAEATPAVVEVEPPPYEGEVFRIVEEKPEFPGGESEMMKFIANNISYPAEARKANVQGMVVATFVVNKDGSLSDVRLSRDIGAGCGEETVRMIKLMPNWTPGKSRGNPVRVQFNLPVKFKLD